MSRATHRSVSVPPLPNRLRSDKHGKATQLPYESSLILQALKHLFSPRWGFPAMHSTYPFHCRALEDIDLWCGTWAQAEATVLGCESIFRCCLPWSTKYVTWYCGHVPMLNISNWISIFTGCFAGGLLYRGRFIWRFNKDFFDHWHLNIMLFK